MAKIDIQNIFKTKKFTELTNKEKISWIDHFFRDNRDEDKDPNPWDAAFSVGADSTALIPGTDSMSQYDYFLDEMWNLRSKLIKQKADTVSSINTSPEVSSVIDSVDTNNIGTSYPGSNLQNPQKLNIMNSVDGVIGNSYPGGPTQANLDYLTSGRPLGKSYSGGPTQNTQKLNIMNNVDGNIGNSYTGGATQNPQKLNIMNNVSGTIGNSYSKGQGVPRTLSGSFPETDDFGNHLNADFEGNYDFEALRDIAVNKNNTQAYNKPFNGEVSRDNTSQPRMMQTENGLRPMTEQEMYDSNQYNASQKILALTGQDDESIARAKAQPIVKPDTTIADGKMGLLGGQPTIPFETLKDTPKPKLDRLGNVIEEDSSFTGQGVKDWFSGVGDSIATFADDAGDYWNKTSLEDMGDDIVDVGADGIAWAANNPLEALSYGLMVIPGVGLVGGTALRTAIGAGKVVLSKPAKAAYKTMTSNNARKKVYTAVEKVKNTWSRPPAGTANPLAGMNGAPAIVPYSAEIAAANKMNQLNKARNATNVKNAATATKNVADLSLKRGVFNPLRPVAQITKAAMNNPGKSFITGAALNTVVTDPGDEFYNKFGNNTITSELGDKVTPTFDAAVNSMTQEQVDSLPSVGQDWWSALEQQDAEQMQAIRDFEIRAAAQQNVNAKTALEDVPINFEPFGPDFRQNEGTNVWTKFRNY